MLLCSADAISRSQMAYRREGSMRALLERIFGEL